MNIVFVAPECYPYTLASALSYFVYGLSKGVEKEGNNVKVIIPRYGSIDPAHYLIERLPTECKFNYEGKQTTAVTYKGILPDSLVSVFLIDNQNYFSNSKIVYLNSNEDCKRFNYFCNGSLSVLNSLKVKPDIIHFIHPYTVSCVQLIKESFEYRKYQDTKFAFSFLSGEHLLNNFTESLRDLIVSASFVTTLSQSHAEEILSDSKYALIKELLLGKKDNFQGILCGIDNFTYNSETDSEITQNFSKAYFSIGKRKCKESLLRGLDLFDDVSLPLFTLLPNVKSKLEGDILIEILTKCLNFNLQIVVLCEKEYYLNSKLTELSKQFGNLKIVNDFSMKKRIFSGSDFLVCLDRSDPSIIPLQIAMKYGAVPIALQSSAAREIIIDNSTDNNSNGFLIEKLNKDLVLTAIQRAIKLYKDREKWPAIVKNVMGLDSSITSCAKKYIDLYETALKDKIKLSTTTKG